jgi:hypothetical protein
MSPLPSQAVIVNPLAETLLVHEDTLLHTKLGRNNHIDTNPPKMSSLLVFNRVYRLQIYSQSWYFRPLL